MWEWREEAARGRWRLDRWGSWVWDEPSPLDRPGAGTGVLGAERHRMDAVAGGGPVPAMPRATAPWSPAGSPASWTHDEPWGPTGWAPEPWTGAGRSGAGWSGVGWQSAPAIPEVDELDTPIFRAVADDRHRVVAHAAEDLLGRDVAPAADRGRDDRGRDDRGWDTAPHIPSPHPGSGPFPAQDPAGADGWESPEEELRRRAARRRSRRATAADPADAPVAVAAGGRHALRA